MWSAVWRAQWRASRATLVACARGRANTALLDPVVVEVYGSMMPLSQVATVSAPEPRMLSVQVWDKANVSAVEKGISKAISASTR